MTPRQFDPRLVQAKLAAVRELLDDLHPHDGVTGAQLDADRQIRHVVERVLALLVDTAVAANGHAAAAVLGEVPVDYAGTFAAMVRLGALPEDLAGRLLPSVGMRNVLVHEYVNVDRAIVAAAVPQALSAYAAYVRSVARWLQEREQPS